MLKEQGGIETIGSQKQFRGPDGAYAMQELKPTLFAPSVEVTPAIDSTGRGIPTKVTETTHKEIFDCIDTEGE